MRAAVDQLIDDFVVFTHTYFKDIFAQLEQKYLPLIEAGDITVDMLLFLVHRDYQQLVNTDIVRKKFSDNLFLAFMVGYPMTMGVALNQLALINALTAGDKLVIQHLLYRVGEGLRLGKITQVKGLTQLLSHALDLSEAQIRMIATTEYHRAAIKGWLYKNEQLGVTKIRFITAADERVCVRCNKLNGKVFVLTKAKAIIPVHVNCRCTWEVVE